MKIIIAADKFKGSLTSLQACEAMKAGVLMADKNAVVQVFPMADGGDGFAAVLKYYLHTQTIQCDTVDPLMRKMVAGYEWDANSKTAIIELAAASGLLLLNTSERNPLKTSTYGTGLLIKHAIENGATDIILGLGGSATNDAGMGILAALGFCCMDADNIVLAPTGKNLSSIKNIVTPGFIPAVQFRMACDVQNVLYGEQGAAFIYAPQKGADDNAVLFLDKGLRNVAAIIQSQAGKAVSDFKGAGAAGGVAAGLCAFFDVEINSGAQLVQTISKMERHFEGADLIITGEGRLDGQTANGKVVQQLAALGNELQIPVLAVCGEADIDKVQQQAMGLTDVISISNAGINKEQAMADAATLIKEIVANYMSAHK